MMIQLLARRPPRRARSRSSPVTSSFVSFARPMFKSYYNTLVPAAHVGDVLPGLTESHLRRAILEQLDDKLVGLLRSPRS